MNDLYCLELFTYKQKKVESETWEGSAKWMLEIVWSYHENTCAARNPFLMKLHVHSLQLDSKREFGAGIFLSWLYTRLNLIEILKSWKFLMTINNKSLWKEAVLEHDMW